MGPGPSPEANAATNRMAISGSRLSPTIPRRPLTLIIGWGMTYFLRKISTHHGDTEEHGEDKIEDKRGTLIVSDPHESRQKRGRDRILHFFPD
jgi:hypothetical protein